MSKKNLIFIPPNGQMKKQDFSLQRIALWLNKKDEFDIILLHIVPNDYKVDVSMFQKVVSVMTQDDVFTTLMKIDYEVIFHRSWMGAYIFGAKLVENFDNVIVNIKDWNFASQEVYEFLYPNNNDFEAIKYIFQNSIKVLSHFTEEQYLIWADEYGVDKSKFVFFPEFCNPESFVEKTTKYFDKENIKLVYAGKIPSTTLPEDYFPGKAHLRSVKLLAKKNIQIDFVLPPEVYIDFYNEPKKYMDFIYFAEMNDKFNIIKGESLNPKILDVYDFGFFELETTGLNDMLYKYAITSKFAFYLEAALPMLVNEKFYSMAKIVKENNLGIVFSNNDLDTLDRLLSITDDTYQSFVKNIEIFRNNYIYEVNYLNIVGDFK